MAGYIGNIPVPQGTQTRQNFTATASQTSFPTIGYTAGFIDVYLNGVKLISGTDFTASNGSDVVLTSAASASDVLDVVIFDTFNTSSGTFSDTTLKNNVTLKNDTHEDSDGGRASKIIYQGEQSGGEISTLAEIQASHDGTADDQKGDLIFKTNDGSDNNAPTEVMRLDSSGDLLLGTTTSPSSADVKQVISASSGAFTQFSVNGGAGSAIGSPAASQMALYTTTGNVGSETYTERMRIDADGKVKLQQSSVVTASTDADDLVIEKTGDTGLSILSTTTGRIYFGDAANDDAGSIRYVHSDNSMRFETDDGERMRLLAAGGLTFNGDTAAANALNDYEEGTFTPTMGGTGSGTTTYATQAGSYTKIGNNVTTHAYLSITGFTGSGNMYFSGWPFTQISGFNAIAPVMLNDKSLQSGAIHVTAYMVNVNDVRLYSTRDGSSWLREQVDSDFDIYITMSYTTT